MGLKCQANNMAVYQALVRLALATCLCVLSTIGTAATQPNIVFVLADDYGYNDIGYHASQIHTPTLDQLAASGVRLENYYVQPICTPTRSQLMSGRYQIHTGLTHGVLGNSQPNGLPLDSPTLADKLKEAGYATHMVGKWHLGFYREEYLPYKRGFDTYFGYLGGAEDYYQHSSAYEGIQYLDLRDQNGPVRTEQGRYSTFSFTERAIHVIHQHDQSKPLFLYLAYQSLHSPLEVPDSYVLKYQHIQDKKRRLYAGMVSAMDEGIANVTQALHDSGLWNNTVFIFSADNGGEVMEGGNNFPLRGWKGSLWEGGIHGLGFVAGGAVTASPAINRQLIHVSDWFPTLVTLAHAHLNGTQPLDGYDQWATINSGAPSPRQVLLHNIDVLHAQRGSPLYNDTWDTRVRAAVRVGDYKLITGDPSNGSWVPPPDDTLRVLLEPEDSATQNVWLFNITADPTEQNDLAAQKPEVVRKLLDIIQAFNDTSVPVRYPPADPRSDPALHGGVWGPWE